MATKFATLLNENDNSNIRILANAIYLQNWNTQGIQGSASLSEIMSINSNVTVMTIQGCNVGIGSTLPNASLDIVGNLNVSGSILRNGSPIATTNWQQSNTTTFLGLGQRLGIGTSDTQGNDMWIAGTISASNVYARNAFFIANDTPSVRNALQVSPIRSNISVTLSSQSLFVFEQQGLYNAHASNTDVYINGLKLVYRSPSIKDYDLTVQWIGTSNTRYNISMAQPAVNGDVVDITVWPSFLGTSMSNLPGYVYQTFSPVVTAYPWQNFVESSNSFIYGNVGIGTATPLAPLHVQGNIIVNGNTVFSNGLIQDAALNNVNAAVGTFGNTTTIPQITVDAKGRVTNVASSAITFPVSSQFTTSGTNVYILNSNVGVGTATPLARLHVSSTGNAFGLVCEATTGWVGVNIKNTNANVAIGIANLANNWFDGTLPGDFVIRNTSGSNIHLGSYSAAPTITLTGTSNVGIGTTTPGVRLDVFGNIRASGDITAFSDIRLKKDLVRIDNAIDRILQLTGYSYELIERHDDGRRHIGLIAQDVNRVLPEATTQSGDNGYMSISYGNMAALFVEGFKEMYAELQHIKQDLSLLKDKGAI